MYLIVLFIFSTMLILGLSALIIGVCWMFVNLQKLRREPDLYKIEGHALDFFHALILSVLGVLFLVIYLIELI